MLFGRLQLVVAIALCACLHLLSTSTRRIVPADAKTAVELEGSFQPDGQYPGERFTDAVGVRSWGSWSGSDDNHGKLTIGPFTAPRVLRFGAGGYPNNEGNTLHVELVGTNEFRDVKTGPIGERWNVIDFELPAAWKGRSIQIVAIDQSKILGGWLAVTEPIQGGRSDGNNALIQTLAAWAIHGLLLALLFSACLGAVVERYVLPSCWKPLAAVACVAAIGYVAFWAYFFNAFAGVVFSWGVLALAALVHVLPQRVVRRLTASTDPITPPSSSERLPEDKSDITTVLKLIVSVGFLHLTLLHLFPTQHDLYTLAANRYREAMPSDNVLPHTTAERLFASESLKNPIDEWLSSDRPPLQAGWLLTTWPASKALGLDRRTGSGASAVWLQLAWVAAAYGLLRSLGVGRTRAAGWVAAFSLVGFFLQNTVYTWPKLSAAAFACGAFALVMFPSGQVVSRTTWAWAAFLAGLAWLSHGGVAFSFIAFAPFLVRPLLRVRWTVLVPPAIILLVLVSPWLAYQRWYDPPANRLFKWHLGGQSERDPRGTWETIRDGYAKLGWNEAWANKLSNFQAQIIGDWRDLVDWSEENAPERRRIEFFHTARALSWWPVFALALVITTRRAWHARTNELALLGMWLALTIVVWCLLMFGKYQAVIHHGSYAVMIGLFVYCSVIIERISPRWLIAIFGLQAATLVTTWAVGNPSVHGIWSGLPFLLVAAIPMGWFVARAAFVLPPEKDPAPAPVAGSASGGFKALRDWWRNPKLNFWLLAALAIVLFARKPHALHTPQLWAEDGSIFLMQADLHGSEALVLPYMGYLHTLPRLIAWIAPKFLDPAWWPHFYNGLSFVIWLAVLARFFTPRFDLPGKPWLALAFVLVPHSGEVFFNITNLQWLTAFVLIQQAVITAPKNAFERTGDLLIVALVTLTGPFGIAFLPLFAWRWWRERSRDNLALLAVAIACAAVQAWFVARTGPRFDYQSVPLKLWPNFVILARRVAVWPLFGRELGLALSPAAAAAVGGVFLVLLPLWALRPDRYRTLRVQVVAAFVLITAAAVYRVRPDTWAADNLDFGDRYFYIPRVLLAWLVIWELHSKPRFVALAARLCAMIAALLPLRNFSVAAPPDYRWAEQVEPIRRGVPADIPTLPEGWTLEYRGRPAAKP